MEQYYQPSPQYTPSFPPGSNSDGFVPVHSNSLVPAPEGEQDEELKEEKIRKKTRILMMDYDSDNTMNTLRS